jgi:hypothetical protein
VRRLEAAARAVLPGFGAALLMVMAAGPTGLPTLVAAVTLPQVVFWSIFRPAAMAPPVVFLLGLLLDLLSLAPLGTGVLTLLVAQGLAMTWRRFLIRQGFLVMWRSASTPPSPRCSAGCIGRCCGRRKRREPAPARGRTGPGHLRPPRLAARGGADGAAWLSGPPDAHAAGR